MLRLHRIGGIRPPDNERLEIADDGGFVLWRTVGTATQPPTPVGRFEGHLSASDLDAAKAAVDAATTGTSPASAGPAHPGSSFDRLDINDVRAEVPAGAAVEGDWATAVDLARRLLHDLTAAPTAAVALDASDGLRVVHVGTEPIELDLSELVVRAARLEDGAAVEHWEQACSGPFSVTAAPGWDFALPFEHDFGEGDVVASVEGFLLDDAGSWVVGRLATG
jgi:hypothetical protein